MARRPIVVKLPRKDMTFEEAVKHVLKAQPMPKDSRPKPRRRGQKKR
jgi:hypothetical protein